MSIATPRILKISTAICSPSILLTPLSEIPKEASGKRFVLKDCSSDSEETLEQNQHISENFDEQVSQTESEHPNKDFEFENLMTENEMLKVAEEIEMMENDSSDNVIKEEKEDIKLLNQTEYDNLNSQQLAIKSVLG